MTHQQDRSTLRAHSTPDPDLPDPTPSPLPDDVPPPVNAPVEEPRMPPPPIKLDGNLGVAWLRPNLQLDLRSMPH